MNLLYYCKWGVVVGYFKNPHSEFTGITVNGGEVVGYFKNPHSEFTVLL